MISANSQEQWQIAAVKMVKKQCRPLTIAAQWRSSVSAWARTQARYHRKSQYLLFIGLLLSPLAPVLASEYFYCAQGSRYIYLGDTLQQVEKACGKPAHTDILNLQTAQSGGLTTRWVYAQMSNRPIGARYPEPIGQESFFIDFQNGVVKAIIIHGQRVSSTKLCSHVTTIAIGDPISRVWKVCGSPRYKRTFRDTRQRASVPEQAFVYHYQSSTGTTTLTFEQFKLTKIDP